VSLLLRLVIGHLITRSLDCSHLVVDRFLARLGVVILVGGWCAICGAVVGGESGPWTGGTDR